MNALTKKLQLKSGTLHLVNAPAEYLSLLRPLPEGVHFSDKKTAEPQHIHLFARDSHELKKVFPEAVALLTPATVFWVMYPKKASGIKTDLGMVFEWPVLYEAGLRPVGSAAIDDNWTALRFKPAADVRKSEVGNSAIENSSLGEYIDTNNRTVKLPGDVLEALKDEPELLAYFEQLAFTHKKEYATWILTAKQEKTRLSRVEKMVAMLREKKKNPSGK